MINNEKKMLIIALSFLIVIVGLIIFIGNYKIELELTDYNIKANIYDAIDLKDYIKTATDSRGNNLKSKIKIDIQADDDDQIDNNKILIRGFGDKKITYIIKKLGKTVVKTLKITVISNPNDEDYEPNYEYEDDRINEDDKPMTPLDDTPLTEEQQKYINSFLN